MLRRYFCCSKRIERPLPVPLPEFKKRKSLESISSVTTDDSSDTQPATTRSENVAKNIDAVIRALSPYESEIECVSVTAIGLIPNPAISVPLMVTVMGLEKTILNPNTSVQDVVKKRKAKMQMLL